MSAQSSTTPPVPATTASLWQALDLPPPEATVSQHQSKRVVLLGRPLSGKRTLLRRLCLAAESQYPSSRAAAEDGGFGSGSGSGSRGSGALGNASTDTGVVRRALYNPSADEGDDDIVEDMLDMAGEWDTTQQLQRSHASAASRRGTGNHNKELPHGAGLVHDYVVQRIPLQAPGDGGFARGGVTKRTVEFFCCDTAGALSSALPTPQSLEEALVLVVVDASQPGSIREQLDRHFDILQTHVTSVLQTFLPTQDEVRRLNMVEAQQQRWLEEEKHVQPLREKLAGKAGEAFVATANVKMEMVNKTVLRVPLSAVCAMKSVVVCTKTDVLDKVSKLYDTTVAQVAEEDLPREVDDIVPPTLRSDLRRQGAPLLPFVAQLVRQYALLSQSALLAVSSRVGTTATDSAGEAALVHPFYRGVWSYLSDRLKACTGAPSQQPPTPIEAPHLCTANFFPTAFLPWGLDTLAVLPPAIASQTVTLPSLPARSGGGGAAETEAVAGAIEGAFTLHHNYLQQAAFATPSECAVFSGGGSGGRTNQGLLTDDSTWAL